MADTSLWPHQQRVYDLVAAGKNVILHAPTGSGKTRAALYPFLDAADYASELHHQLPRKCIYSVPMRVLAKQFVDEYTKTIHRYNLRYGLDIQVAIQTGEQPGARWLEADLIFATIDQTLSSFLLAPYSLSRGQANLNAAAVMASYLVFDEFHLFDPISTLPTTLHLLQMLKGITPFVLMTATFSADLLGGLAALLDAVVVPGDDAEREQMRRLESQQKTRRYHVLEEPLTAERVLDVHTGRSLVICNTVDRARRIHAELAEAVRHTDTEVMLLHSRFLREDRDRIEATLRAQFGKDAPPDGSLIVVSTQAIEVGVDITSTRLHTELAPANSILQRAGRCARYPGDEGDVFIYRRAAGDASGEIVDLCENVAPYMKQEDEFVRTLEAFRERDGTSLDFAEEQAVVSTVHGPRDRQLIDQLRAESFQHRRRMYAVMRGEDPNRAGNLIRDVWQQQVTIHAEPDALLDDPYAAPSFGLHPGTLQKYVKSWLEQGRSDDSLPWAVKWLKEERDPDADQANRVAYRWIDVYDSPQEVWGAPLVVVHPRLATYHPDLGFIPDRGGSWQAEIPLRQTDGQQPDYRYHLETYERHIALVYEAAFDPADGFWNEVAWLARRLEQHYAWPPGSVRRAAELAVLLHDVGKLSVGWQRWVRDYQQQIGQPVEPGEAYAHTELQTDAHRDIERAMRRRPRHAVEGAVAVLPALVGAFGEDHPLTHAAFSAIARHHSPQSEDNTAFRLIDRARRHIQAASNGLDSIALLGIDEEVPSGAGAWGFMAEPDQKMPSFLAYLLLVRVLRRADKQGTALGIGGQ